MHAPADETLLASVIDSLVTTLKRCRRILALLFALNTGQRIVYIQAVVPRELFSGFLTSCISKGHESFSGNS